MSKRKISISIRDPVLFEFVRAKANTGISAYVCDLIRQDMECPKEEDLDKKVEEIVRRLLQNTDGIGLSSLDHAKRDTLSVEDRELLKSLF